MQLLYVQLLYNRIRTYSWNGVPPEGSRNPPRIQSTFSGKDRRCQVGAQHRVQGEQVVGAARHGGRRRRGRGVKLDRAADYPSPESCRQRLPCRPLRVGSAFNPRVSTREPAFSGAPTLLKGVPQSSSRLRTLSARGGSTHRYGGGFVVGVRRMLRRHLPEAASVGQAQPHCETLRRARSARAVGG